MLRKLLDFGKSAVQGLAVAVLLAGPSGGALAQGIASPESTAAAKEEIAQPVVTQAVPASHDWSEWALALSVLSLIGVVFLVATRPKHRHRSSSSSVASATTTRLAGATDELTPGQFKEVQKMIARALADQSRPASGPAASAPAAPVASVAANRPKQVVNAPRPKTASTALPPPEAPVGPPATPVAAEANKSEVSAEQSVVSPAPPAPTGPRRAYVSSAPVNGRFRRNVLQGQPAHNSIYELTWDPARPDETTFQVNPDPASHPRHISSYADVLEPACEFNLPQGAASRIVTEAPGLLRRVDGDDWEIVRKARIHFA